jgi:hypothetical protein
MKQDWKNAHRPISNHKRQPLGMLVTYSFLLLFVGFRVGNQILYAPDPIRDASRHCRGKATGTVISIPATVLRKPSERRHDHDCEEE